MKYLNLTLSQRDLAAFQSGSLAAMSLFPNQAHAVVPSEIKTGLDNIHHLEIATTGAAVGVFGAMGLTVLGRKIPFIHRGLQEVRDKILGKKNVEREIPVVESSRQKPEPVRQIEMPQSLMSLRIPVKGAYKKLEKDIFRLQSLLTSGSLVNWQQQDESEVKRETLLILGRFVDGVYTKAINESKDEKKQMSGIVQNALSTLIQYSRHKDESIRVFATYALGRYSAIIAPEKFESIIRKLDDNGRLNIKGGKSFRVIFSVGALASLLENETKLEKETVRNAVKEHIFGEQNLRKIEKFYRTRKGEADSSPIDVYFYILTTGFEMVQEILADQNLIPEKQKEILRMSKDSLNELMSEVSSV